MSETGLSHRLISERRGWRRLLILRWLGAADGQGSPGVCDALPRLAAGPGEVAKNIFFGALVLRVGGRWVVGCFGPSYCAILFKCNIYY